MPELKVLEVSPEALPFVRTGGLGDVLGALPRALRRLGHQVKLFLPAYGQIDYGGGGVKKLDWSLPVSVLGKELTAEFYYSKDRKSGVEYYLVGNDDYFDRNDFYLDPATGKDYDDNDERFVFFSLAVLEAVRQMRWQPDIIHVHDWQAALVPVYLKHRFQDDIFLGKAKSILTIHNLGYQGLFPGDRFDVTGLPESLFYSMTGSLEFFGKVNFLKGGIVSADHITTVSQRYSREIQENEEFGCGLEGVLGLRAEHLTGILNGVDYTIWSPTRDKKIPHRYSMPNLSGKRDCKVELMGKAGLPVRDGVPLIGMITRLADQKGLDLVEEAADQLFSRELQMIVLGTGDQKYHKLLTKLERDYPEQLRVFLAFDDHLAHEIEAGTDIFLMPSRYEPCGLSQLYSLKYGTVPIVRDVGGLADTIVDYNSDNSNGTGFVFREYSSQALLEAIDRALEVFARKRSWNRIIKTGMAKDFSWDVSARKYAQLFKQVAQTSLV
jgi:starch synthase